MALNNTTTLRTAAIAVLVGGIGYIGVLPAFWPAPKIFIECPSEVRIGEDLPVTVTVSAWHGVFHVDEVRIIPNAYDSAALEITNPLHAMQIYSSPSKRYGWAHRFRLLNKQKKKSIRITAPLSATHTREKLSPGMLVGAIDVTCAYAHYSWRVVSSQESTYVEPFSIMLSAAHD